MRWVSGFGPTVTSPYARAELTINPAQQGGRTIDFSGFDRGGQLASDWIWPSQKQSSTQNPTVSLDALTLHLFESNSTVLYCSWDNIATFNRMKVFAEIAVVPWVQCDPDWCHNSLKRSMCAGRLPRVERSYCRTPCCMLYFELAKVYLLVQVLVEDESSNQFLENGITGGRCPLTFGRNLKATELRNY